jgi:hypothetical protein
MSHTVPDDVTNLGALVLGGRGVALWDLDPVAGLIRNYRGRARDGADCPPAETV